MLEEFYINKQKVQELLVRSLEISNIRNDSNGKEKFYEIKSKLNQNSFSIVAFGGFSSGKSSFFNALVGEKIFPSLHTPTTASINQLHYGTEKKVVISYKTITEIKEMKKSKLEEYAHALESYPKLGKTEELPWEELKNISKENPESIYIKEIHVYYPSEKLKPETVVWIDTPGTDSVIEYHKVVTYSLIDSADAILFFIYAPMPFKDSDWRFLEDIREIRKVLKKDKFFFILNAIDAIQDQTVEEVVAFVKDKLVKKSKIENPKIIPISSKLALLARKKEAGNITEAEQRELNKTLYSYSDDIKTISLEKAIELSRFHQVEQELSKFLLEEKGKQILKNTIEKSFYTLDSLNRNIALEEWSIEQKVEEIDQLIEKNLKPQVQNKKEKIQSIIDLLKNELSKLDISLNRLDSEVKSMVEIEVKKDNPNFYSIDSKITSIVYQAKTELEDKMKFIVDKYFIEAQTIFTDLNQQTLPSLQINIPKNISITPSIGHLTLDYSNYTKEIHHTVRTNSEDLSSIGALAGGILAFIIPGGLGFLGGYILGGIGGSIAGSAMNGREYTERVIDYLGLRDSVFSKLKPELNSIKDNFMKMKKQLEENILLHFSKDFYYRIQSFEDEIYSIQNKKRVTIEENQTIKNKLQKQQNEIQSLFQEFKNIYEVLS